MVGLEGDTMEVVDHKAMGLEGDTMEVVEHKAMEEVDHTD